MSARSELLAEVDSLKRAADLPILIDVTVDPRVRRKLIAGVAITAFITVEQFLRSRSAEIARFVSTGASNYQDLSTAARRALLLRTGRNFVATIQGSHTNESEWIAAATAVGRSMSSVVSSPLDIAGPTLTWAGSNVQEADVEEILQILGCKEKPWESLTVTLKRSLRSDVTIPTRELFTLLARSRHSAAHAAYSATTVTELRTLPRATVLFALAADCLASHLALELQRGRSAAMPSASHRIVRLRFVERKGRHWRHIEEGSTRGKRFSTRNDAWVGATQIAGQREETVVEVDSSGEPINWLPAFCP